MSDGPPQGYDWTDWKRIKHQSAFTIPIDEDYDMGDEQVMSNQTRPTFETIYMRLAHELAKRSTCARLRVGTVITSTDFRKVLAVGYNGNATGLPNRCDSDEVGNCGCLHSEENAIINCDAPRETPKLVFVTHLPCAMCAKRLINLGNVQTVYYASTYRNLAAIELLGRAGINVAPLDVA